MDVRFMPSNGGNGKTPMLACMIQLEPFGAHFWGHAERGWPWKPNQFARLEAFKNAFAQLAVVLMIARWLIRMVAAWEAMWLATFGNVTVMPATPPSSNAVGVDGDLMEAA